MKKILLCSMILMLVSCSPSKNYITVTGYEWSVTLKNGDYATGVTQTKREGEIKISNFANGRKSAIKKDKIKTVNRKVKISKFN